MKKVFILIVLFCSSFVSLAQTTKTKTGYEITIQLKNCKDTVAYLTYYEFGVKQTASTCHKIKNGEIVFKGKGKLKKGAYSLTGQDKKGYLDFFIDDATQNLELKSDETEDYFKGVVALNS